MASPWAKIEKIEPVNFSDIMSEEYAKGLQARENKKLSEQLHQEITEKIEQTDFGENIPIDKSEVIANEVLSALNENTGAVGLKEITCNSDYIIAQVLQTQFDLEHDEELKRVEKAKNKDSKVSVSYDNFRIVPNEVLYESDNEEEEVADNSKKDWDCFETVEKKFNALPKWGCKVNEAGELITKHDAKISGLRNACRVMTFPPDFATGDAAGFEMQLSNAVFNHLKTYSNKRKHSKMHDRRENMATAEMGIDEPTRLILYGLINNQILEQVNGIISTGKEAVLLHADTDSSYEGDLVLPKEVAIKIFKTTLNEFKQRDRYIKDDYRFKDRFSKQNNRAVIHLWAEKEMHNLIRIQKCGIDCPKVIVLKKHVLVMSFIGTNGIAASKLKDVRLNDADKIIAYETIIKMMHTLYNEAKLVHADLSEYNILWHEEKCWLIDVAQSVEPGHPSALEFLMRDCHNICYYFNRIGVSKTMTKEELFSYVTGLDPITHNTAMLERMHIKGAPVQILTAPDNEEVPEEFKPLSYPFDYAWEKSKELKSIESEKLFADETEALKVLTVAE